MFAKCGLSTHQRACGGLTSSSAIARMADPETPSVSPASTSSQASLTDDQVKTELAQLNAPQPVETSSSESSSSSDLNRFEAAAEAADAPAAAAPAPPDPAAVMALADLAISALSQLAPSQIELPDHLTKLTPQEKAILTPFAIKAAPKFAEATAQLDQYAHLVFVGLVGWFGFVRWRAIEKLTKVIEARSVVTASPERPTPDNPKDSEAAHPGEIFRGRMPGSPF